MFEILNIIPGRKKKTSSKWVVFNAICCSHRGHNPDKRMRGGIIFDTENRWLYNCFNCHFKCGFTLGKPISGKTRQLLQWCGIDDETVNKWNIESLQQRDLIDYIQTKRKKMKIKFNETKLPKSSEPLNCANPKHKIYIDYLTQRKIDYRFYQFSISPNDKGRNSNRIIVPYTFENKTVGYISRYLDNKFPKYVKEQQPGYIFGYDFQKPEWEVCILVEGIFDALSLNACALTCDTINDEQAYLLSKLNRQIIFVPDQDASGLNLCERAIDLGYKISIPDWGKGVKDVNDAVVKFGKLPTLLSILQSATHNKIKIEIERKRIDKRVFT